MTDKHTPTILIILGITGDLTAKKIAPALFNLYLKNALPEKFRIVGFGRKPFDDKSIQSFVSEMIRAKIQNADLKRVEEFSKLFSYQHGLFESKESYEALKELLDKIQEPWQAKTNRLFYLAVPPDVYQSIFEQLKFSGLSDRPENTDVETRILVEKPFGKNSETAEKLDSLLGNLFAENKIYRIDHYLAKEMVQNILTFRFSNDIFEKTWNKDFIEKIEIRLWETLGVEHRGSFYDGVGALRDVGQNHLLQMLAFITMNYPLDFQASALHLRRAQLLNNLKLLTQEEIKSQTYRAQYEGYQTIAFVPPNSNTETYFKIKGTLTDPRWKDVPVIFESGKRMHEQRKEIIVTYAHPKECFCPPGGIHYKNKITFSLEPTEGIAIEFWSKKPGLTLVKESRTIDFILRDSAQRVQYVEEYEKLLLDCIVGDQTLFVSTAEVKAMWAFIDPIMTAWGQNLVPLKKYTPDTNQAILDSLEVG
ncbi:MAG: glucose-6-phosphate dehydrogenase [Candidatus Doudnabacteria bacterium RIFCSPLOWO2_02_FULL_42_9]|uniref:Glucose-6-phosphate 1-dehydrogenase n=1 Tax=Candidatus Doudnabacteria bacterium RIFCSPHIGHO2_01_FULL_41_86 TaxID=1817821 RepID=A0A1F5N7Q2_9BACT|nr:MAG: glucose-6-phosphate dehydrogenase [Candidatus Doudnabacteria bacterium RIFCSPHIGHO2_01_FULL_41_86]OGE74755.1 MAG: glucose-6-phosphate dehydrogenase [Candidatus Doudnabacteria bacterium RIFCSPHIGHO2_01_43_10]OGE85722.1 MAG: glucose-6-phosphate dehydrogenase [Candidatus Doudnabacteria bacterium RIFCSPHIGHO2_12_FULL_42_22]OGE87218.1 MAG: glucose-6-phosphate dehydrogenase [Candidatus Doudnabacteria bacterium RIFCSPHIGHO2_02_FULL_42_25]OGE92055.1 MAG: glucose-6-phosphate dehydrogenase [Candi